MQLILPKPLFVKRNSLFLYQGSINLPNLDPSKLNLSESGQLFVQMLNARVYISVSMAHVIARSYFLGCQFFISCSTISFPCPILLFLLLLLFWLICTDIDVYWTIIIAIFTIWPMMYVPSPSFSFGYSLFNDRINMNLIILHIGLPIVWQSLDI